MIGVAALALCVNGANVLPLSGQSFELGWQHSVEKVEWRESWSVQAEGMKLERVFIKGSAAGMEPAPHAGLVDGWWQWQPDPEVLLTDLVLASSGLTGQGWQLCDPMSGRCIEVGDVAGDPLTLTICR